MNPNKKNVRLTLRTGQTEEKATFEDVSVPSDQKVRILPDGSECFESTDAGMLGVGDTVKIIAKIVTDGEVTFKEVSGVVMERIFGGDELLGEQLVPSPPMGKVEEQAVAVTAAESVVVEPVVPTVGIEPDSAEPLAEAVGEALPGIADKLGGFAGALGAVEMVAAMLVQDKRFVDSMMALLLNDPRYIDGMIKRIRDREHYLTDLNKAYQNQLYMASGAELSTIESENNSTLMGMRNSEDHPTDPGKPVFFHLTQVQDHGPKGEHILVDKWVELDQPGTLPPAVHAAFQADDVQSGVKYYIALLTPSVEQQRELLELAKEEVSNDVGSNEKPDGDGAGDAA